MKLDQVELLHVRRRLAHPFRISLGAITAGEFVVLRGRADGLTVYGEANIDARPFYVTAARPCVPPRTGTSHKYAAVFGRRSTRPADG